MSFKQAFNYNDQGSNKTPDIMHLTNDVAIVGDFGISQDSGYYQD